MVTINIGRKEMVVFGVFVFIFLIVGFSVAFGGTEPSVVGHSIGEIDGVQKLISGSCVGQIMVGVDASGAVICEDKSSSGNVDLGCIVQDVAKGSSHVYAPISLMIGDKNICEDDDGCTYMLMKIETSDTQRPVTSIQKSNDQIYFQYESSGKWKDFGGTDNIGDNGDGISKSFRTFDANIDLMDDHPSGENSKDEWTLLVRSGFGNDVVRILICDSSI